MENDNRPDGLPSVSCLRRRLSYCPRTGTLTWRRRPRSDFGTHHHYTSWLSRFDGKRAGSIATNKNKKYLKVSVCGKNLFAHRVAWAIYYGSYPKDEIDHINGDSIANLRDVPRRENCRNVRLCKKSKSGYGGVSWHADSGKWQARIKVDGRGLFLGCFDDPAKAAEKLASARKKLGFHDNHGKAVDAGLLQEVE